MGNDVGDDMGDDTTVSMPSMPSMPSRVPALIFEGRNDGFYTEALGAYYVVTVKKTRKKHKVYYEHESGEFFMYRYHKKKLKKGEKPPPSLWVISHTLNDLNGYWIGACSGPDDPPSAVNVWVTHKPGDAAWIKQPAVKARDDEGTLYNFITNGPAPG